MRVHDFHRKGILYPEDARGIHLYGTVHVETRQSHGTGYVEIGGDGTMEVVRTHNTRVDLDRPFLQTGWTFKTEDMSQFVDLRQMNRKNWRGIASFLVDIGYPKESRASADGPGGRGSP